MCKYNTNYVSMLNEVINALCINRSTNNFVKMHLTYNIIVSKRNISKLDI